MLESIINQNLHSEKLRKALRQVMLEYGLNRNSWCKQAGISESALRHFLEGVVKNGVREKRDSMNSKSLAKLASTLGLTTAQLLSYADRVKVVAYIDKNSRVIMFSGSLKEKYVSPPYDGVESSEYIAYEVEEGNTLPQLENIKVIYFFKESSPITQCLNIVCAVKLFSLDTPVIGKVIKVGEDIYNLIDANHRILENVKIEWISKIKHSTYR